MIIFSNPIQHPQKRHSDRVGCKDFETADQVVDTSLVVDNHLADTCLREPVAASVEFGKQDFRILDSIEIRS